MQKHFQGQHKTSYNFWIVVMIIIVFLTLIIVVNQVFNAKIKKLKQQQHVQEMSTQPTLVLQTIAQHNK